MFVKVDRLRQCRFDGQPLACDITTSHIKWAMKNRVLCWQF